MISLRTYLTQRLEQLEHRKMMIPRYVERPEKFLGKNDFSLDDLPKIQDEIEECKVAIKAVEAYKEGKKRNEPCHDDVLRKIDNKQKDRRR